MRNETGQASIFLLLSLLTLIAVLLWQNTKSLTMNLAYNANSMAGSVLASTIMSRVKVALENPSLPNDSSTGNSCSGTQTSFSAFRNLSASAAPLTYTATAPIPCILEPTEAAQLSALNLSIEEIFLNGPALTRKVRVSLTTTNVPVSKNSFPTKVTQSSQYQITIPTLSFFNLVFTGTTFPLVSVSGGAQAIFVGTAFYAQDTALSASDIFPIPSTSGTATAQFTKPVFVKPSSLLPETTSPLNMALFGQVFTKGIETNALNSSTVPLTTFLPDATTAWNTQIDYSYLAQGSGYPLPEWDDNSGTPKSAQSCSTATALGFTSNAAFTAIPTGGLQGFSTASSTCSQTSNLGPPNLVFTRTQQNLTVTLSAGDNVFCGFVAANNLTIKLQDAGNYAVFGTFVVNKLTISGPAGSLVYFYNPSEGESPVVSLPAGQTEINLLNQFASLGSSTAYNFFLPFEKGSAFTPQAPTVTSGYFKNCSGALSGWVGLQTSYQPLSSQGGFNALLNNSNSLYAVVVTQ